MLKTKGNHVVVETDHEINKGILRNDNMPIGKSLPSKGFDRNNKWRVVSYHKKVFHIENYATLLPGKAAFFI